MLKEYNCKYRVICLEKFCKKGKIKTHLNK